MLNSVVMMGRLTAEPELRTTPNGVSVCSFTIAVDRPHQRSGAERVTDFFDCIAWRSNAEFVSRFFHKGSMICVQGYMTVRTYQDKTGANRRAYEIVVDSTHFTGESRRDAAAAAAAPIPAAPAAQNAAPAAAYASGDTGDFVEIPGDDDLPF